MFKETGGGAAGPGPDGWLPQDKRNPKCQSAACQKLMAHDSEAYCLPAFLLYSSQFIAAIAVMMFGSVAIMFARSVESQHRQKVHEERMNPVIKMFLTTGSVLLVMMWAAASIAGASMKVSNMVFALAFVAMIAMGIMVGATVGKQALNEEISKIPLVKNFSGAGDSLNVQGLFMLCGGWVLLPFFFFISFWNQMNRKYLQCTKDINNSETEDDENELWLTGAGHRVWVAIKGWKWTLVFKKVVFIGTLYFVLSVGAAKYTNLGLAELLAALKAAELSLIAVSGIYICVGLCMFLLPPVPGVPVYLTGGILLSGMAEKQFRPAMCAMENAACKVGADCDSFDCTTQMDETQWNSLCGGTAVVTDGCLTPYEFEGGTDNLGADGMATDNTYFYIGILYASLFAFLTKLLAICMQQKGIGGLLGKKVGIRQAVDVNSDTMKAIKVILTGKGCITKGKVCILVGGPDWPTSVLTGVLGLNLVPMIMGSLPVSIPITLTVAAGATMLKTDSSWVAIQGFTLALAAMGQTLTAVAALVEIEKAKKLKKAQIAAIPDDEQVKELDVKKQQYHEAMLKATEWKNLKMPLKLILLLAAGSMMVATTLFMQFVCFESVEVTSDLAVLDKHLDPDGNTPLAVSIITHPYGYIALAAELAAWVLNYLFGCWASHATNKELALRGEP